jgi:hypothetical protein
MTHDPFGVEVATRAHEVARATEAGAREDLACATNDAIVAEERMMAARGLSVGLEVGMPITVISPSGLKTRGFVNGFDESYDFRAGGLALAVLIRRVKTDGTPWRSTTSTRFTDWRKGWED